MGGSDAGVVPAPVVADTTIRLTFTAPGCDGCQVQLMNAARYDENFWGSADKTVTGGPFPGSYTSPNGSAGKLHLTWQVPFAAGELKAVARRGGRTVATDVLRLRLSYV